jgi:hypothetical protein
MITRSTRLSVVRRASAPLPLPLPQKRRVIKTDVKKEKKAHPNKPQDSYKMVQAGLRRSKLHTIRLPSLRDAKGAYTVGGLMVAFFGENVGRVVTKEDLVRYLRSHGCQSVDPQPRHLGMQIGLNFLVQGCKHPRSGRVLRQGEYCLLDVARAHPNHHTMHRARPTSSRGSGNLDFESIKAVYEHRCVCCGSREGQPHLKNKHLLTRLDRGHCDPRLPLDETNCIPMCTTCNMVYKDRAVINKRGFISSWLGIETHVDRALSAADAEDDGDAEDAESFTTCPDSSASDDPGSNSNRKRTLGWWIIVACASLWSIVFPRKP